MLSGKVLSWRYLLGFSCFCDGSLRHAKSPQPAWVRPSIMVTLAENKCFQWYPDAPRHSAHLLLICYVSSPASSKSSKEYRGPSMAITNVSSSSVVVSGETSTSNTSAMAMVTTLFFMWGFVTCLNDILIPHLKAIFDLNYAAVMFVQFAFFSG